MTNERRSHAKWVFTQEESIYFQLTLIFYNSRPHVTESQKQFLIYLYLYPNEFKERLIREGRFQSLQAIRNAQHLLLTNKILVQIPDAKAKNLAYVYDIHPKLKKAIILGDFESVTSIRVSDVSS